MCYAHGGYFYSYLTLKIANDVCTSILKLSICGHKFDAVSDLTILAVLLLLMCNMYVFRVCFISCHTMVILAGQCPCFWNTCSTNEYNWNCNQFSKGFCCLLIASMLFQNLYYWFFWKYAAGVFAEELFRIVSCVPFWRAKIYFGAYFLKICMSTIIVS